MSAQQDESADDAVDQSSPQDNVAVPAEVDLPTLAGGKRKKGNRLVDDTATLLNFALEASGTQQTEVNKKLQKSRERSGKEENASSGSGSKDSRQSKKSKKLREMKDQLRGQSKGKVSSQSKKGQAAKSSSQAPRKSVAFE